MEVFFIYRSHAGHSSLFGAVGFCAESYNF